MKIESVKQTNKNGKKQVINCPQNTNDSILVTDASIDTAHAPVAQRIEQRFPKPRVVRSTRTRGTTKLN